MPSTIQPAPQKEMERTNPSSSKTEVRPNAPKYRKVVSQRQLQANRANTACSKKWVEPHPLRKGDEDTANTVGAKRSHL